MTAEQFAYWLQGFAELNSQPPSAQQWQAIQEHLATVFQKVTPAIRGPLDGLPYVPPSTILPYQSPSVLTPCTPMPGTVTC